MGQHLVDFVFQYLTGTYYRGSLIENFTKIQIYLELLLINPVSTDNMSSVVCSVSFETIKSLKIVWPQIWTLSHASMADFSDFLLKTQHQQILNVSQTLVDWLSLHWWNRFSKLFCFIWKHKDTESCLTPNTENLPMPALSIVVVTKPGYPKYQQSKLKKLFLQAHHKITNKRWLLNRCVLC